MEGKHQGLHHAKFLTTNMTGDAPKQAGAADRGTKKLFAIGSMVLGYLPT